MLYRVVYNQDDELDCTDDPDDCRHRMMFLFLVVALAATLGGLALGFLLDWMQGRL
jgi:hypothetical protein